MYGSSLADPDGDVRAVLCTDGSAARETLQERWG
jgi:hypothetical protein